MSKQILVLNCGSSSIKYKLFDMPGGQMPAGGVVERIGEAESRCRHTDAAGERTLTTPVPDHQRGLAVMMDLLTGGTQPALAAQGGLAAVGHRVVHGGEAFAGSVRITDAVVQAIEAFSDLAPLHNPPNLTGIRAATALFPGVPQVACFDTAFHSTLPERAYLYALPYDLYETHRIRRYGFHGTSHRYVAARCAALMGKDAQAVNAITCHLGNGCSITAVRAGRSVDTSMGLTPLEGLVMGTRSGDIDPAIVFHLARKPAFGSLQDIGRMLNKNSGLAGLSGLSNDVRTLLAAADEGNQRAALALEVFAYRVKKYIGAYAAILPGLDALVFTGGIGENAPAVRRMILDGLDASLGIALDGNGNAETTGGEEAEISGGGSQARVFVIPTDEERVIASDTFELISNSSRR